MYDGKINCRDGFKRRIEAAVVHKHHMIDYTKTAVMAISSISEEFPRELMGDLHDLLLGDSGDQTNMYMDAMMKLMNTYKDTAIKIKEIETQDPVKDINF